MNRRKFLITGGLATAAVPVMAGSSNSFSEKEQAHEKENEKVNFTHDGLDLSISEYADLLTRIESSDHIVPDVYSNGGVVSALISLPLKYMHTTVESVHKDDVENVIKLIYQSEYLELKLQHLNY